jgi:hypothetical protein
MMRFIVEYALGLGIVVYHTILMTLERRVEGEV